MTEDEDALFEAAKKGKLTKVKDLVSRGTNVNAKNKYGVTALHLTAIKGHTEISRCLIDKGADINAKDENGLTPLHLAAWEGHMEIARCLIEKGADVNDGENVDENNWTMLDADGCTDMVTFSRNKGKPND